MDEIDDRVMVKLIAASSAEAHETMLNDFMRLMPSKNLIDIKTNTTLTSSLVIYKPLSGRWSRDEFASRLKGKDLT